MAKKKKTVKASAKKSVKQVAKTKKATKKAGGPKKSARLSFHALTKAVVATEERVRKAKMDEADRERLLRFLESVKANIGTFCAVDGETDDVAIIPMNGYC
jgi:hypothetical protein